MKTKKAFLIAVTCGVSVLCCGMALAESADDVLSQVQEAAADQDVHSSIEMAGDIVITASDGNSLTIGGSGTLDTQLSREPLAFSLTGKLTGDLLGTTYDTEIAYYVTSEDDGSLRVYQGINDEWTVATIEADEAQTLTDAITNASSDSLDAPITFTLQEDTATSDEGSLLILTNDLTWSDIPALITWASEQTDALSDAVDDDNDDDDTDDELDDILSTLSLFDSYLSGLVLHSELDVSADTYLPTRYRLDLTGSDLTNLNDLLSALFTSYLGDDDSELTYTVTIGDDAYVETTYEYNALSEITVPQQALSGAQTVEPDDMIDSVDDLLGDL